MADDHALFAYGGGLRFVADCDGETLWIELPDELLSAEIGSSHEMADVKAWLGRNIDGVKAAAKARIEGRDMDTRFKHIFAQEKA